jgi:hypothetical protein
VRFRLGNRTVWATVVEDRGLLDAGRRVLRVRLDVPYSEPMEFEIPATDVRGWAA